MERQQRLWQGRLDRLEEYLEELKAKEREHDDSQADN
jgi:hypothetical protein